MIFFAERIKYYRKSLGYSQQQIAKFIGVERSTYTYYETGKTQPNFVALEKLCKIFGVGYTDLLSESKKDEPVLEDNNSFNLSHDTTAKEQELNINNLSTQEKELIAYFRLMSDDAKKNLLNSLED